MPMTELRSAVIDVRPRGPRGLQGADGAPGDQVSYETFLQAMADTIEPTVTHLRTSGKIVRGIGGGLYVRRPTEPLLVGGKGQSVDGAWWEKVVAEPEARSLPTLSYSIDGDDLAATLINGGLGGVATVALFSPSLVREGWGVKLLALDNDIAFIVAAPAYIRFKGTLTREVGLRADGNQAISLIAVGDDWVVESTSSDVYPGNDASLDDLGGVSYRASQSLGLRSLLRVADNINTGVVHHRPLMHLLPVYSDALLTLLKNRFPNTGAGDLNILIISDSTGAGYGAGGASNVDSVNYAWPTVLRESLINRFYPATPESMLGTGNWEGAMVSRPVADARVLQTGAFVPSAFWTLGGAMFEAHGTGAPFKVKPKRPTNILRIYFPTDPSYGTMRIDANGGTPVTANMATTAGLGYADVSAALGLNTYNITSYSGYTPLIGWQAWDNSAGPYIRIFNASINGGAMVHFIGDTYPWDPLKFIAWLQPKLTIVDLTINDGDPTASPGASYATNFQTLITKLKLFGDVIVVGGNPYTTGTRSLEVQAYRQHLAMTVAAKNGIPFISKTDTAISEPIMTAAGMMLPDGVHPMGDWHAIWGEMQAGFIG
ncbi:hypothetical protein [Tardiphaga sp.]|uniref:SGNH/GDSL hydrolase family protein n=1 Tax=Tardiphaga sp. TaxID=1926292 RepID=UPI00263639AE|nr:hypothetical protein [Tardiphaga sp.]MDB5620768.1 hypothetical protein [Tardiphaga sp.]